MKDKKGRNLQKNEDQLKDGRYRYRYTDSMGKRRAIYSWKLLPSDSIPKGKKTDLSLREKKKKLLLDEAENINSSGGNITVYELVQKYLKTKVGIANSTLENYKHITEKNIKNTKLGNMKVSKVCKSDILSYYAYLYKDRNFSVGTIQLYQNIIFPAFQLAVEDSVIRLNPCKGAMKGYKVGSMTSHKKPLTVEEQKILLDYLKNKHSYYNSYYTIIALILGTGLRISEALGLTWDDIDFDNKCIKVYHQIIYKKLNGKYQFYSTAPKHCNDGEGRTIPLQNNLIQILKEHKMNTYFLSKTSNYYVNQYTDFVFINAEGKVSKPDCYVRAFHGIVDEYNKKEQENSIFEKREPNYISDFTPHILRHTYCTRMAENGIDIKVLQELMGHKNIAITMQIYNHVDNDRSVKEVNRVPDVLAI